MAHWQNYSIDERIELLEIASAQKGLPKLAIEKDWWVTAVLKALSMTQYADLLSFKGGTSLSKGWNLIERFSEDIDIALKRQGRFAISGTSNNQLAKVRRTARHYIVRELPEELTNALKSIGITDFTVTPETSKIRDGENIELRADTHPSVIYVNYNSIVEEVSEYLQHRVKIEISCLSMDEPVEIKELRSFISESVSNADDMTVHFQTVIPTRTFLEKIFLLHEEFQRREPRHLRMSRHLYDLECIMDTEFGIDAINDTSLYREIIQHREKYNRIDGIDYSTHAPATLNFLPPAKFVDEWRKDYNEMLRNFLYFKEDRLSFEELLDRMSELTIRIRQIR